MNRVVYSQKASDHMFTYRYAQPDEYHFCQDSVILAYFVAKQLTPDKHNASTFTALDLCSGCGVVGLELAYFQNWIHHFDFLEIQSLFRPYFSENLCITQRLERNFRFLENDFRVLKEPSYAQKYDLIVSNPPYFRKNEGSHPAHSTRHRARFFTEGTPMDLMQAIEHALKPQGRAYVLMRPGQSHGRDDDAELSHMISDQCTWRIAAEIRGTWVIEITKKTPKF